MSLLTCWLSHAAVMARVFAGRQALFGRQLGQPTTRFYATWLPAGHHELTYIAQVRHAGAYAWLPAVLTPMYGRVQRAESAAARVVVEP